MPASHIPRLHMSNPAPSLHFAAPWCWCRCWQPQAPAQAPSSAALPMLPTDRHPNCTPTPPQPSPACCQGRPPPTQTSQASREQPLATHGGTLSIGAPSRAAPGWPHSPNPALPFPITPSSLCRAGAPLPGSLCTRRGHGAELLARRAQPAGHGAGPALTTASWALRRPSSEGGSSEPPAAQGCSVFCGAFARQLYLQVRPSTSFTRIRTTESLAEMPGLSVSPPVMLPLCNVYSCSPVSSPSDIFMVAIGTNENQIKKNKKEQDRGKNCFEAAVPPVCVSSLSRPADATGSSSPTAPLGFTRRRRRGAAGTRSRPGAPMGSRCPGKAAQELAVTGPWWGPCSTPLHWGPLCSQRLWATTSSHSLFRLRQPATSQY